MKKSVIMLAMLFAFSTAFTSCREENKDDDVELNVDEAENEMNDVGDDIEDAANDTGDAIENAAEETGDAIDNAANEVEDEVKGNDDM